MNSCSAASRMRSLVSAGPTLDSAITFAAPARAAAGGSLRFRGRSCATLVADGARSAFVRGMKVSFKRSFEAYVRSTRASTPRVRPRPLPHVLQPRPPGLAKGARDLLAKAVFRAHDDIGIRRPF